MRLKSDHPEIGVNGWKSLELFSKFGAFSPVLENLRETFIFAFGRTHNRSRSPRFEASSQQSNVGKGSRQNRSVTSGKGLALRTGCQGLRWKLGGCFLCRGS